MLKTIASRFVRFPLAKRTPFFRFSQSNIQDSNLQTSSSLEEMKTAQIVAQNIGMNQFLMRVYNTTGLSILGAMGSSFMFMQMPIVIANLGASALIGGIMTLAGFVGANYMKPTNIVQKIKGYEMYKTTNSTARLALYSMGVLGLGLGASPLFMMAQAISPSIIPTAFGITTAIFGGASLMAYSMPKDKMLGYGRVLGGSLLGLIGLQVIGLLSAVFMGPNPLSTLLFQANNYIGIGLFSAFIAFDTHLAIKMYELKEADHLGMAIQFLLDFWNILINLISIFSRDS